MTFLRPTLTVLLCLGTLHGCSLHSPQAIPLATEVPKSFAGAPHDGIPVERWWEAFGDADLNTLMEEAFAANLDLKQAVARLQQLEAATRSSAAARRPTLNVQGQASREKTPGFFGDNEGNSYALSLAAAFELDLWNKLNSRRHAAHLEENASRADLQTLYLQLSAQVVDLYYLAAEQHRQLQLTEQTIAANADTLERVERRYREGLVPALDVYQARQNLTAAQARRPLYLTGLAKAQHALSVLLSRYPQRLETAQVAELQSVPESFAAGLPSELLARRPDVHAAFLRVQASDERIAAAIAERFPAINLAASYGELSSAFSTGDITGSFWELSAGLLQPLIDGGRRRAEVDRSRAVFAERLAHYQEVALVAFQEVEDALAANRGSEERITLLLQRVEASRAALRLAKESYLQGLSDYLPVLTAQSLAYDAESQLLAARRQLIVDRISLARALGGNWMAAQITARLNASAKKD